MPKLDYRVPMPVRPRELAAHYARVRQQLGCSPKPAATFPRVERTAQAAPLPPPQPLHRERLAIAIRVLCNDSSVSEVMQVVATVWGLTVFDFGGRNQSPAVAVPRGIAMALAQVTTGSTLGRIGRLFGGRDHTSVHSAIARYRPLVEEVMKQMGIERGK